MNRFIIKLIGAGVIAASVLAGCADKGENYYKDGLSYYEKSDYSKAVECFQKAIEVDSENSSYMVYLGMSQLEAGSHSEAINTFLAVTEVDSENRDAFRGLGIAYMRADKYQDAINAFSEVEELSEKQDDICLDAMKYRAECYYSQGQYADAIAIYDKLISEVDKDDKYLIYYMRGRAYIKLEDENTAVLNFEEALNLKGNDYDLCCNMYYCFKEAGYTDRAESYIKRVLQLDDISDYDRGKFYFILEEYGQAEEIFTREYDDGNVEAAYYLAMTYEQQALYDKAESLYKKILSEHSGEYQAYNQYGAYLIERGEYETALVYIETGLEITEGDEQRELLYNQAVCYEYMYNYEKAYELFSDYLTKYPSDEQARKELDFLSSR